MLRFKIFAVVNFNDNKRKFSKRFLEIKIIMMIILGRNGIGWNFSIYTKVVEALSSILRLEQNSNTNDSPNDRHRKPCYI